jgi:hypothetical protein
MPLRLNEDRTRPPLAGQVCPTAHAAAAYAGSFIEKAISGYRVDDGFRIPFAAILAVAIK